MTRTDTGRRPRFRPSLDLLEGRETPASLFTAAGTIAGGPASVGVFGPNGNQIAQLSPFESSFTGGARAATGELDGNPNTVEVVVVPGAGGGPRVQVITVNTADGSAARIADFLAFEPGFRDGLRVAVGRLDPAATTDQIVVGPDAGGGPRVRTFNLVNGQAEQLAGPLGNFFAFEDTFRGGVRVAVGNPSGTAGLADQLVVGAGVGGAPRVQAFGFDGTITQNFFAPGITGFNGVNVGFGPFQNGVAGSFLTDALAGDFSQRNATLNAPILAQIAAAQAAGSAVPFTGTNGVSGVTGVGTGGIGSTVFGGSSAVGTGLGFGSGLSSNGLFGTGGFGNGLFNTGGFTNGVFTGGPGITSSVFGPGLVGTGFGSTGTFGTTGFNGLGGVSTGLSNTGLASLGTAGSGTTGFGQTGFGF
ncbi:MAG: hypothetical protein K2X82_25470 [Gemmataceae bacterium]|nr:hypothetical protein [Gemmataceae bacterium]